MMRYLVCWLVYVIVVVITTPTVREFDAAALTALFNMTWGAGSMAFVLWLVEDKT